MGFDNVNVNVGGPVQPTSTYKTKVLKGNHSFASQVTDPNMKYVIKYDFDLGDESVAIPENCVLEFDGGSLSNGIITLSETLVTGAPIFSCRVSGTCKNEMVYSAWGSGDYWLTDMFALAENKTVIFDGRRYTLKKAAIIPSCIIVGNNSIIALNNVEGNIGGSEQFKFGNHSNNANLHVEMYDLTVTCDDLNSGTFLCHFKNADTLIFKRCSFIFPSFSAAEYPAFTRHCFDVSGGVKNAIIDSCKFINLNHVDPSGGSTVWFRHTHSTQTTRFVSITNSYFENHQRDEVICFAKGAGHSISYEEIYIRGNRFIVDNSEGIEDYGGLYRTSMVINLEGIDNDVTKLVTIGDNVISANAVVNRIVFMSHNQKPINDVNLVIEGNDITLSGTMVESRSAATMFHIDASLKVLIINNIIRGTILYETEENIGTYNYFGKCILKGNTIEDNSVSSNMITIIGNNGGLVIGNNISCVRFSNCNFDMFENRIVSKTQTGVFLYTTSDSDDYYTIQGNSFICTANGKSTIGFRNPSGKLTVKDNYFKNFNFNSSGKRLITNNIFEDCLNEQDDCYISTNGRNNLATWGVIQKGFSLYDNTLKRDITYLGSSKWVEKDGAIAGVKRTGTWSEKPSSYADVYEGFSYMINDTVTGAHIPIFAHIDGSSLTWRKADGTIAKEDNLLGNRSGTKAQRPIGSLIYVGFQYLQIDDENGTFPIWAKVINGNSVTWVDATGTTV